jgi:hypothetical protein
MPKILPFHSVNEARKPLVNRRYHDNSACAPGRDIPQNERKEGNGGYKLCEDCERLDARGA